MSDNNILKSSQLRVVKSLGPNVLLYVDSVQRWIGKQITKFELDDEVRKYFSPDQFQFHDEYLTAMINRILLPTSLPFVPTVEGFDESTIVTPGVLKELSNIATHEVCEDANVIEPASDGEQQDDEKVKFTSHEFLKHMLAALINKKCRLAQEYDEELVNTSMTSPVVLVMKDIPIAGSKTGRTFAMKIYVDMPVLQYAASQVEAASTENEVEVDLDDFIKALQDPARTKISRGVYACLINNLEMIKKQQMDQQRKIEEEEERNALKD